MADFSMSLKSLSTSAQRFMFEKDIIDADGVMTTSERSKLAAYLSGTQDFPEEYIGIQDELIEFGRDFDKNATRSALSKSEANSVESNMSEKEKNEIDSMSDYSRMSAVANGTIKGYTPAQRAYAKALLEKSSYAREAMAREENGALKTENQRLLAENSELKAQIEDLRATASKAENENSTIENARGELSNLPDDTIKNSLKNSINNIESLNDTIINSCNRQKEIIENFENGRISESTLNNALNKAQEKIEEALREIEEEKEKGAQELAKAGLNAAAGIVTSSGAKTTAKAGLNTVAKGAAEAGANAANTVRTGISSIFKLFGVALAEAAANAID